MKIVCVGDCGVDRYVPLDLDRPGGITLNVSVHLRECLPTARITVCTAVGTDDRATHVIDAIARTHLEGCITRLEGATPIQYIAIEPSGEKRFIEYDAGVLNKFRLGPAERALVSGSDLLVTTVFAQVEGLFDSVMSTPTSSSHNSIWDDAWRISRGPLRVPGMYDVVRSTGTGRTTTFESAKDLTCGRAPPNASGAP